ncbi:hypothetical protein UFOVP646_20 [uncultured Caudovirales phage]|uniref:Uncharacterized protein n=1 Tax=uncultured Caudovirales phage TaxID=2100421 RepID=A0A6J5N7A9_9CAUD|nr:hypothetical protein UFOVP284_2 [uncultured Caudovirales phage]CAB4154637.1 hypothetical protein UFOVP646_20 [uncultured Caudovirales phage]
MFDTYTRNSFATTLTHEELATKIATIEQIVSTLYLNIINNEDYVNFSEETEIALTKVCNELYYAIHNDYLF